MSTIKLILESSQGSKSDIVINGHKIPYHTSQNSEGNLIITVDSELKEINEILIDVKELSSSVKLEDIVIDGIRFGLVTFLCTTINDLQHTELKSPGQIKIIVNSPAWEFWCKKMNEFSYERYPLGSIIE